MDFKYLDEKDTRGIVNNMFIISFVNNDLPFKTILVPTGFPSIAYIYGKKQKIIHKNEITRFKKLIISGQFDSNYDFSVKYEGTNFGINLHPTALYKILGTDISLFKNKHVNFNSLNKCLSDNFSSIFIKNKDNMNNLIDEIHDFIENLNLFLDKDVKQIDKAINYIFKKEGMIKVIDLLKIVPLSQKSLEIKFKKIIGLTPGKYIRLIRFTKLMRKYESKKISINDLIYMYNYYDHSHFIKDFKLFMSVKPKIYFKKEYPLIKAYSKDL